MIDSSVSKMFKKLTSWIISIEKYFFHFQDYSSHEPSRVPSIPQSVKTERVL